MDTLSEGTILSKMFLSPSEKGSTLKEKNLLPLEANSFLLQLTTFQKELGVQVSKQEVAILLPFLKTEMCM